jgi:CBS domain containing-hemolysin-like protein
MEVSWVIWLAAGLLLCVAAAFVSALEAVLWQTPRSRMDQWPRLPSLQGLAADFAHPRDCLFTLFMATAGVLRALGWWFLWLSACGLAPITGLPAWAWAGLLIGLAALWDAVPSVVTARRPRVWELPLLRAGGLVLRLFGPVFDRVQPVVAKVSGKLFPWSTQERPPLNAEEAETLVWMREEDGEFLLPEAEVLAEVLRLSRQTVRQYMTPRVDVAFFGDGMSNEEVRAMLLKKPFLRAPVIGETPDEVVGLLDTRTLNRLPAGMHFTEALLPPSFVPETMEASRLLAGFFKHRQPLAVVLDEFGGVEGVVTLDDFVEELLGTAAPRVDSDLYIETLGDGRLLANGTARLADLSEYLGMNAAREGIETIGGYVVNTLGKLPRQGASVRLGPWKVTVRSMTQRRVREVILQKASGKGGAR